MSARPRADTGDASPFVAAGPVWALVRRRQAQWGYSDDDMAALLQLGSVIDVRGWMLRSTAGRTLRRLAAPAPATAGTHRALTGMLLSEYSHAVAPPRSEEARRIQAELGGEEVPEAAPSGRRAS
jgi:hypothetical protein